MTSTFGGLGIGLSSLLAQRLGIDTAGHNVANANTEGYSRQDVLLETRSATPSPFTHWRFDAGQVGTGVDVTRIRRLRDAFTDLQIRLQSQSLGHQQAEADALGRLEQIVAEPSDSGLAAQLTQFWNAWDELGNNPQSSGARANLLGRAQDLVAQLNQMHGQMADLQVELDGRLVDESQQINGIADQVAELNLQIKNVLVSGDQPNDLMDRRDLLLDKLSCMTSFQSFTDEYGGVSVYISGQALVDGCRPHHIAATLLGSGCHTLTWEDGGAAFAPTSGEIYGLQQARDQLVPQRMQALDQLAAALIAGVNTVHRTGYGLDGSTGLDFFTGSDASDIAVSQALADNPGALAAAGQADALGDGSKALLLAASRHETVAALGGVTVEGYYQAMVTSIGAESRAASDSAENQDQIVASLEKQRQSLSGVSLDEEATNLIRYQQAYAAAAQYISVVSEMLDVLINVVGARAA
jgi:flagellar hook-associated protein 1